MRRLTGHVRRGVRPADQRGDYLIEFAVVLPVFLSLTFGVMEFGRMVFDSSIISHVARVGVRWAMVHGSSSASPASSTDVQNYVQAHALGLSPLTVTTTWTPNNKPGSTVRVQVQYNFSTITRLLPTNIWTIRSAAEMTIAH